MLAAPLAVAAARERRGWLAAALALGCCGDVLLGFKGMFLAGLIAFLAGHLCYIRYFGKMAGSGRKVVRAAVIAIMISYGVWLMPSLGGMAVPAWLYLLAITAMAVTVLRARLSRPWAALGAVMFLVSDAALAASRFHGRFAGAAWIIWGTYCLAQWGLSWGGMTSAAVNEIDARATLQEK